MSHPRTIKAQCCLTSAIGQELGCSTWYGRYNNGRVVFAPLTRPVQNGGPQEAPELGRRVAKPKLLRALVRRVEMWSTCTPQVGQIIVLQVLGYF